MLIDLLTNTIYQNRLEAKLALGSSNFNKRLKKRDIVYISRELKEQIKNNN